MAAWPYHATYAVAAPPSHSDLDSVLVFEVTLTNTGDQAWLAAANAINLAYHWQDQSGKDVVLDGLRTPLPTPIQPGATVRVPLRVEPPTTTGNLRLVIDLVQEGVSWFSWQGVTPLVLPIHVGPSSHRPRVTLINGNCLAGDAIGNNLRHKLHYFESQGYQAHALVEYLDPHVPLADQARCTVISLDQLVQGGSTLSTQRAARHFAQSDLYIFDYSIFYRLLESMRLVQRGTIIFDYHGVTPPELWPDPAGRPLLVEGQQRLTMVRHADYAIAHSRFTAGELLALGLIAPERVSIMPYIVPLDQFRPGPRDAALVAQYGLFDQNVLLYVGRMASNKRIVDLVAALALVRNELPNTVLLLVGDTSSFGPYVREVEAAERLAQQLGCAEQVIFTGKVSQADLPRYYSLCDLYVTASQHEGFCIPVIEAMAAGHPVVGTNTTALPDTIGPGGLTFEPGQPDDLAAKILQLLTAKQSSVSSPERSLS